MKFNDQQHATVLAALRYYQEHGQGDPSNHSDAIHDIATNGGQVTSLDAEGIDELCEMINNEQGIPSIPDEARAWLVENLESWLTTFEDEPLDDAFDGVEDEEDEGETWTGLDQLALAIDQLKNGQMPSEEGLTEILFHLWQMFCDVDFMEDPSSRYPEKQLKNRVAVSAIRNAWRFFGGDPTMDFYDICMGLSNRLIKNHAKYLKEWEKLNWISKEMETHLGIGPLWDIWHEVHKNAAHGKPGALRIKIYAQMYKERHDLERK